MQSMYDINDSRHLLKSTMMSSPTKLVRHKIRPLERSISVQVAK
ncbi:hypothetical protein L915_01652 [Phytophthora nicotianae]|uniref:Uncharacterized protein n=1 Tax=Phytophthora nicotianae TaxID=4792 RepID=W2JQZ3_PHYNI|nr:hypothetical protein L915_01652 [Phytophthora nicotianae]ETL48801.1 hypothetical protein L916_01627 [Phytophthora nicotianae]